MNNPIRNNITHYQSQNRISRILFDSKAFCWIVKKIPLKHMGGWGVIIDTEKNQSVYHLQVGYMTNPCLSSHCTTREQIINMISTAFGKTLFNKSKP